MTRTRRGPRSSQPIHYKLPPHLAAERSVPPGPTRLPSTRSTEPTPNGPVAAPSPAPADRTATVLAARVATDEPDGEVDYTPLVSGSFRAAMLMLFTQVLSALLIANFVGGVIRFAFWFDVIPYLEIWTDGTSYVTIITWSTLTTVAVTCIGVLHALCRRRSVPLLVDGWATGIPMAGLLLGLQAYRDHRLPYEVIETWPAIEAGAVLLASTMIFFGFRPGGGTPEGRRSSRASWQPRAERAIDPQAPPETSVKEAST